MIEHKIDPGTLDSRIGLLQPTETDEDAGNVSESFALATTVWGAISYPISGQNEELMSGKIMAVRTTNVIIRNYSSLNERWRLRIDSQDYDIISITYLGRKEFMQIEAERRL